MKKLLIIFYVMLLMGCSRHTIPSKPTDPVFLFEKDGTRVYYFEDKGQVIYFSTHDNLIQAK